MSVQEKNDIYARFLEKFTEEILLALQARIKVKKEEIKEEKRASKEIEAEKIRIKFIPSITNQPTPIKRPVLLDFKTKKTPVFQLKKKQTIEKTTIEVGKEIKPMQMKVTTLEHSSTNEYEIDFGRLTSIVLNPSVTYIDCSGPNKDITIKAGKIFLADITLSKEEIESIIKAFSERARIPLIEGMLKARVKNLEIAAVVSLAGSSFVLKKYQEISNQIQPNNLKPMFYKRPFPNKVILR